MGPKIFFLLFAAIAHSALSTSCPGCRREQDVESESVRQLLSRSLSRYSALPVGTQAEEVLLTKLNRATTQVVSGIKYDFEFEGRGLTSGQMYSCEVSLLSQPWAGRHEEVIKYSCEPITIRNKRSTLIGGEFNIDLEANGELAKFEKILSSKLAARVNTKNAFGVVKVLKATRQVVAGQLTRFEAEIAETDCIFSTSRSLTGCSFKSKDHQVCSVAVLEKPWLNKVEVTELTCRRKQDCFDCLSEINSDDVKATALLNQAIANLNAHADKVWALYKINSVQFGAAASGLKYSYKFEARDEKGSGHDCEATLLSQPSLSARPTILHFNCTPQQN